jgi:hypothetical protein
MEEKKKRTQICFDIRPDLHQKLKTAAFLEGKSQNLWVETAIKRSLKLPIENDNGNQRTENTTSESEKEPEVL